MKNSSYYIAPVRDRTHDLPHTVASNMVKVSHALNHSATATTYMVDRGVLLTMVGQGLTSIPTCESGVKINARPLASGEQESQGMSRFFCTGRPPGRVDVSMYFVSYAYKCYKVTEI